MNILQRRNKRNSSSSLDSTDSIKRSSTTSSLSNLSRGFSRFESALWARWQALAPRDQLALAVLSLFLLLFIGGYGGYSVHQAAKDSKEDYQQQVADYFWLRSQAGNIDSNAANAPSDGTVVAPANSVNSLLNNAGIGNAQVAAVGDTVQLSFAHPSQALIGAALSNINQQGWQFTQLSMQQDTVSKQIEVQATIAR